ncbi:MAG TPA: esterase, partial [Candidatus Limnocylindria bacterium]
MRREYRRAWSAALGRDMELLVFGDRGTPVLVFPTSMGRFYQWEDFGMIAHLQRRIDEGLMQLWCVDSVDSESFYDTRIEGQERARRHIAYDRYLADEVVPAIRRQNSDLALELVGASFGAFHAVALATRH